MKLAELLAIPGVERAHLATLVGELLAKNTNLLPLKDGSTIIVNFARQLYRSVDQAELALEWSEDAEFIELCMAKYKLKHGTDPWRRQWETEPEPEPKEDKPDPVIEKKPWWLSWL